MNNNDMALPSDRATHEQSPSVSAVPVGIPSAEEARYEPINGWRAPKRWRCGECSEITANEALLRAANPFDPDDEISGCPECKSVSNFSLVCDFPGCNSDAGSGEPTPEGGYIHRCFQHSLWAFRKRAAQAMSAGTAETQHAAQGEARQRGPQDAPITPCNPHNRGQDNG